MSFPEISVFPYEEGRSYRSTITINLNNRPGERLACCEELEEEVYESKIVYDYIRKIEDLAYGNEDLDIEDIDEDIACIVTDIHTELLRAKYVIRMLLKEKMKGYLEKFVIKNLADIIIKYY